MSKKANGEGSIYRSGNRWVASISITDHKTGKRKRRRRHVKTKAQARVLLAEMQKQQGAGYEVDRMRTLETCLGDYKGYRKLNAEIAQATHDDDSWMLGVISDGLGLIKLQALTAADCEMFLRQLATGLQCRDGEFRKPIKPERIRRVRNMLISVLDNEMRLGRLERNVARMSFAPGRSSKAKKKRKSMNLDDFALLLESSSGPLRLLIELVGRYGLRPAEARAVQWKSVDLESTRLLKINVEMDKYNVRGPAKTQKARRRILLSTDTVERLKSWKIEQHARASELGEYWEDPTAILTTDSGAPYTRYQFNDQCKKLCTDLGIKRITPYHLRHTAVSYQARRGHSAWKIADWSGTSEAMIADVYRDELDDVSDLEPIDPKPLDGEEE